MGNKVTTLGSVAINDLIDLGLRMPDGSAELFEVVDKRGDYVVVMTKNIIDFMPFNASENKHSGKANSYAESSIRSYLVELYQSVAKENKLLEVHTFGDKEFFLPTATALGFGAEVGESWELLKTTPRELNTLELTQLQKKMLMVQVKLIGIGLVRLMRLTLTMFALSALQALSTITILTMAAMAQPPL